MNKDKCDNECRIVLRPSDNNQTFESGVHDDFTVANVIEFPGEGAPIVEVGGDIGGCTADYYTFTVHKGQSLKVTMLDDHAVAWFLRQLLRHQRGKILLVWDRSPIHRGSEVRALLAAHPRLKIEELPAYAPELNPVEVIWSHLKFGKLSNLTAQDVDELELILNRELKKLERNQKLLKKLSLGSELTGLHRMLLI